MPDPQSPEIVAALQLSFQQHLKQAEAYEAQAAHFNRWGYPALGAAYAADALEERHHAKLCTDRLQEFDVQPDPTHETVAWPQHDLEGILDSNYAVDAEAAAAERDGYVKSVANGDPTSAAIFAELFKGSEDGMAKIEAIRMTISQIGLDNYLAGQIGGE